MHLVFRSYWQSCPLRRVGFFGRWSAQSPRRTCPDPQVEPARRMKRGRRAQEWRRKRASERLGWWAFLFWLIGGSEAWLDLHLAITVIGESARSDGKGQAASPRASAAALRMAAMLAR